jgi:hypothetical protein
MISTRNPGSFFETRYRQRFIRGGTPYCYRGCRRKIRLRESAENAKAGRVSGCQLESKRRNYELLRQAGDSLGEAS